MTPEEIADAAIRRRAKAAIVHLHARNPETGGPDAGSFPIPEGDQAAHRLRHQPYDRRCPYMTVEERLAACGVS